MKGVLIAAHDNVVYPELDTTRPQGNYELDEFILILIVVGILSFALFMAWTAYVEPWLNRRSRRYDRGADE